MSNLPPRHQSLSVGVEQNRKQRFPVNSITSKLVLKSIYASGSTGPFFDNHFMNKHDSSFAKKTDFLSRYLVLSEIRCARKKSNQKQEQNLLSKVFNLFEIFEITEQEFLLDSLLSAWTFVYWNMNTRWKYFLNYYHRILFLEIQMTTVQRMVVFTGVELREIMFLTSKFRWYKNVNFRYHQLIHHLLYF